VNQNLAQPSVMIAPGSEFCAPETYDSYSEDDETSLDQPRIRKHEVIIRNEVFMALEPLHNAGVLHGVVSFRCIVFNSTGNSVKFMNLGNSTR